MKPLTIAAVAGAVMALSFGAAGAGQEVREDLRDIRQDRRELRRDVRQGR